MLQVILGLGVSFAVTILKTVTKNPKVAAEEGSVIAEIAQYATQADTLANGTVWTSSAVPVAPTTPPAA
jgi:hypothetical protein